MAQQRGSSFSTNNTFDQSLITDTTDYHLPDRAWSYARNAINNTKRGDLGKLVTEQSNTFCTFATYTIIGALHLEQDKWLIFSTNNVDSEIGTFVEGTCVYTKLVNDRCLKFNSDYLIKGITRPTFDCSFNAYWDDGLNVTRVLDINDIPWVQNCVTVDGCTTCTDTDVLDCDLIRLESFIDAPCVEIVSGPAAGSLLNGTYQVQVAYLTDGQRVSDYSIPSNVISLFSHDNTNSSIDILLGNLDVNFDDIEVVLISTISEKTVARRMGVYSTRQTTVTIDYIDLTLPVVPLGNLTVITPVPDKSEAMYTVGEYALRVGPTTKFDFNYQPIANQIETFWQSVEYKNEYYKDAGTNIGYMRDEVYPFFIRFVYKTGDKSRSYHIPGRAATGFYLTNDAGVNAGLINEDAECPPSLNIIETYSPKVFEVYNTATLTSTPNTTLPDGGLLVAEGRMGYWESSELYDDKNAVVWNANIPGQPQYDLCGKAIRHHKFPENVITSGGSNDTITNHYKDGGQKIRIMGVRFDNIQPPKDNDGNLIPNIVGYEILRGNRTGSKSVLYKGMINNMFTYEPNEDITFKTALYANYPFNDLNADPFISKDEDPTSFEPALGGLQNYDPNDKYSKQHFTFHSPDTTFAKPFLVDDEVKIYGAVYGDSTGSYLVPDGQPRQKFVTDLSFIASIVIGFGYAISQMNGTRSVKYKGYEVNSDPIFAGTSTSAGNAIPGASAVAAAGAAANNGNTAAGTVDAITGQNSGNTSAVNSLQGAFTAAGLTAASVPSTGVTSGSVEIIYDDQEQSPGILKAAIVLLGNPMFLSYLADGTDVAIKLIKNLGSWKDYVVQYQSLCKYENFGVPTADNRRRAVDDARYLTRGVQDYQDDYIINHVNRNETVIFNTNIDVENVSANIEDVSRPELMSALPGGKEFDTFKRRASSHYVALKTRLRNQYGQLQTVRQLLASSCVSPLANTNSGTIFGGDTYIGKYSEKNTLFYFQQWLNGQNDGAIKRYDEYKMFRWTAFWMNTDPFDIMKFVRSVPDAIANALTGGGINGFLQTLVTPSDLHCFDRLNGNDSFNGSLFSNGIFLLKNAYMYLFNSGVKDFFVESEFNVDCRDWGDDGKLQHYPIISDLKEIFKTDDIKLDNFYRFDRSLSHSFMASQKIPWGIMQDRKYNPVLSETCFTKFPRRLMYSLPQKSASSQDQSLIKKDQWSVFLPNNFADYGSNVTAIKSINKTGALILFENEAPGMLPGVDQLRTTGGANVIIGDGNLFGRKLQQLSNSEKSYEYGSCQSRLSVLHTPAGLFWMNLNQGKIFAYAGGLQEISLASNKYWLNQYLPYQLTKDFPTFSVLDNPVSGIGCQTIYDNEYSMVYFCKKDYRLKPNLPMPVEYIGGSDFLVNKVLTVKAGDPAYFDDCSWTLSYDPKIKQFISFHDWHPDLSLGAKNTFVTTKGSSLWKHNNNCSSFCKYYDVEYPFEVEFTVDTKFNVATVRNIEYYIESYVYDTANCYDRFHVLDHGFDEAIIYNSEQVSGLLKLHLSPKNDIKELLLYPKVQFNYIDILFSKEEQKYRFNQFWDITKDRGEFTNTEENIWVTENNGYIRNLNPTNLNYDKDQLQRKKFRHYNNKVILKRTKNTNVEILVSIAKTSQQNSFR